MVRLVRLGIAELEKSRLGWWWALRSKLKDFCIHVKDVDGLVITITKIISSVTRVSGTIYYVKRVH